MLDLYCVSDDISIPRNLELQLMKETYYSDDPQFNEYDKAKLKNDLENLFGKN